MSHEFVRLLSAIEKSGVEIERLVERLALDDNTGQLESGNSKYLR